METLFAAGQKSMDIGRYICGFYFYVNFFETFNNDLNSNTNPLVFVLKGFLFHFIITKKKKENEIKNNYSIVPNKRTGTFNNIRIFFQEVRAYLGGYVY